MDRGEPGGGEIGGKENKEGFSPGVNAAQGSGQMELRAHVLHAGAQSQRSVSYPRLSFQGRESWSPGFTLGYHQGTPSSSMSNVVTTGSQAYGLFYLALSFEYKMPQSEVTTKLEK